MLFLVFINFFQLDLLEQEVINKYVFYIWLAFFKQTEAILCLTVF